jgi:urease accessory protein
VTSSLGGGLVDGDRVELEVTVECGATAVVTSQASQKVYRGASSQRTLVRVHAGATALVVPDPVVPFRGARFEQATSIELADGASLVLGDVITAGRIAYGERWAAEHVASTLDLAIAGERVLLDRVVVGHMGRFDALATAIVLGPRFADLAAAELARIAAEPLGKRAALLVAASPLAGGAIVRLAGTIEDVVAAARAILRPACSRAGEDPWARRW